MSVITIPCYEDLGECSVV